MRRDSEISGADGGTEGAGEGLGEALDVGVAFGFDHDAGELFGAGIAQDDAAIFAESRFGFGKRARDFGKRIERWLGFHFYVNDDLRVVLEALNEGFDFAVHGNQRCDFYGGEQAVASRAVSEKNDVAGLFAADDVAAAEHFFENVAVADGGASERNAFAGQRAFEAEIGHGSGDHAIPFELVLRFEVTRDGKENAIAVDDFAGFANEEGSVGIAIEGDTELGALGDDALLQAFEMERTAAGIDVAAIGGDAHLDDVGAERAEEFGAELVGGAIGTVKNNAETGKFGAGKDTAAKKIQILRVQRLVSVKKKRIFRRRIGAVFENVGFQLFFDRVGELHAGVREKLDAIVLIGIVRCGDDDTCLKIILANEAGDAWGGDYTSESYGRPSVLEACSEESGDVRAGFAGIHANEGVGSGVLAEEIGGERTAGGKKSRVVERRGAGNAANAVGTEKLFGHERLTFNS